MVYASYATGYKPGGVAFLSNVYDPYKSETVETIEVGTKNEFLDHRLRLNVDVFDSTFKDFQATTLTGPLPNYPLGTIATGNAGQLVSKGAEVYSAFKATRSMSLDASVTYDLATFTNYQYTNPANHATTNYTGTTLTNAPKWAANVGANYSHQMDEQTLKAFLGISYRSQIYTVVGDPAYSKIPGYSLVNARISLTQKEVNGGSLEYGVYVRNLLNKYYDTGEQSYGAAGYLHYTTLDAFRTFGAFARYNF